MNKRDHLRLRYLLFTFFCVSLGSVYPMRADDTSKCQKRVENIIKIIGNDINALDGIYPDYRYKDTLMEDEGAEWKAKIFYMGTQPLFMVETSWIDSVHISRITILSSYICTKNNIRIGKAFKSIKNYVSNKIPSVPDGYFCLKDKKDRRINYWFNIERYPELIHGLNELSKIPSDITVANIVVNIL